MNINIERSVADSVIKYRCYADDIKSEVNIFIDMSDTPGDDVDMFFYSILHEQFLEQLINQLRDELDENNSDSQ